MERIIELLVNLYQHINFIEIIKIYEKGVLYRFGKDIKTLEPGLRFKIPFVDEIEKDIVVTQTLTIPSQTILINDKEYTVKSVVRYSIFNIRVFQTSIYDRIDAIQDTSMEIIKETIELKGIDNIDNEITKKIRNVVKKWGIEIEKVTLTDVTKTRSIRLFNENILNN